MMTINNQDTICAIATAPGGAIGIIRVSGKDSINIVDNIFVPATSIPLKNRKAGTVTFGKICNPTTNEVVDEVLVSLFRAPHSYTGEDTAEISCHGSNYILQQVLQLLILEGCRQAEPGEFTMRAFINGKMDLSQAEAVADLIASTSSATHKMAMSQMRGDFSRKLKELRARLLHLTSLMELELDFSDHEELEFADRTELKNLTAEIESVIKRLVDSFSLGNAIKNGVPVAIIGKTNAGKSTLLNALVGEERAIVSDVHGTTRDVIEDTVNINGTIFRFIDTAGIRETSDIVESLGIERTFKKIDEANIVLWIIDRTDSPTLISDFANQVLPICKDKNLIVILNKADLHVNNTEVDNYKHTIHEMLTDAYPEYTKLHIISISAKQGTNLSDLRSLLTESINIPTPSQNDVIVTNIRHYEALTQALDAIHRIENGLNNNIPTDLISQDLHECLFHLSEITGGEITTSEVLSNIFKNFCVGK